MSARELNRRTLGKTIVALGMLAAIQPFRPLIAAGYAEDRHDWLYHVFEMLASS